MPVEGFGGDAACIKCGKAQLEVLPREEAPVPVERPVGWVRDPNGGDE